MVKPLFFPGGDIGRLSVCGTVNDLSVRGARPLYLSAGFIIEEGLLLSDLERIVASMASAAAEAGVSIVCGDTKVVERRAADGLYINTAGVGIVTGRGERLGSEREAGGRRDRERDSRRPRGYRPEPAAKPPFRSPLRSDVAPLNSLAQSILDASSSVHAMRDPTRGGLATTLKGRSRLVSGDRHSRGAHTRFRRGKRRLRDARSRLSLPRQRGKARDNGA